MLSFAIGSSDNWIILHVLWGLYEPESVYWTNTADVSDKDVVILF